MEYGTSHLFVIRILFELCEQVSYFRILFHQLIKKSSLHLFLQERYFKILKKYQLLLKSKYASPCVTVDLNKSIRQNYEYVLSKQFWLQLGTFSLQGN